MKRLQNIIYANDNNSHHKNKEYFPSRGHGTYTPCGHFCGKLHVVYLKALGLSHKEIERIARTSADSVTRYLKDYNAGGLAALGVSRTHRPVSSLQPYHDQIKAHFLKQPPHTVSEASHEIEALTGIKLGPSACRDFMRKRLGMKFRKMAVIPAKADPKKQAEFLNNQLEPLLEEEKQGRRKVFFVDAAHFVMGAFLGMLWCFERLFLKSSSGRRRYNVLGAFSAKGADLVTVTNDAYINSGTIVDVLFKIKQEHARARRHPIDTRHGQRPLPTVQQGDGASQSAGHRHPFPTPLFA